MSLTTSTANLQYGGYTLPPTPICGAVRKMNLQSNGEESSILNLWIRRPGGGTHRNHDETSNISLSSLLEFCVGADSQSGWRRRHDPAY